jgi:Flp pilus assembly protein TadB
MEEMQRQGRDSEEQAAQDRRGMTVRTEELIVILVLAGTVLVLVACTSVWEYVQSMLAMGW